MNQPVNPEFLKAFDHYKKMVEQYGKDHPITEQALALTMHYTPEHVKAEIYKKAKKMGLLPRASGYTDDGKAVYSLDDIAKHFDLPIEAVEGRLSQMMENRQKVGLSNDWVSVDSEININRVQ